MEDERAEFRGFFFKHLQDKPPILQAAVNIHRAAPAEGVTTVQTPMT